MRVRSLPAPSLMSLATDARNAIRAVQANPLAVGTDILETILKGLDAQQLLATVQGMLTATKMERPDKFTTAEVPDWRTREAAVRIALSYGVGLPVQRSIEVHQAVSGEAETLDRMLSSPATRAVLLHAIDERERSDKGRGTSE